MIGQFLINGLITGAIYSLVSLGFALVYNTTRIFHIAYAALYMTAPYFLMLFYRMLNIPLVLAVFLAITSTIIAGLIIEQFVYNPLSRKKSPHNVIMISSLGVMIVIINLIALFFGNETKIINPEISSSFSFGVILITYTQLWQFSIATLLIICFFIVLKNSGFGIKTRALRDDQILCSTFGIDTYKLRRTLMVISSFFAAVGGCLVAYDVGMDPYVGLPLLLNAVVALIIGGIGRFEAPVLGGILLGLIQAMAIYVFSAKWQDAITFVILILFLILRPQGILGEKLRSV
ncbi:MAG: branched-chain amino acid ABC transporter permease [Bacteroidales bacterium]